MDNPLAMIDEISFAVLYKHVKELIIDQTLQRTPKVLRVSAMVLMLLGNNRFGNVWWLIRKKPIISTLSSYVLS